MNLSTWAIRNPVPPIALFLMLCVVGLVSFQRLPVTQMPNIDLPVIQVSVGLPGAAPSEIVSQVVRPIETELADVSGVRHVTATATDAAASLTVEFAVGTDTDRALNDVKDAVTSARSDMPDGTTQPTVQRLNFSGVPILTYAVSDPTRSIEDLSAFVDDVVSPALQAARGVGRVERLGGAEREIDVELDPDRLLALGLSALEVSSQLSRINLDLGGGSRTLGGQGYSIRALGSARTVESLAETPIRLATGKTVRLDQIGTIVSGASDADSFALFDGQSVMKGVPELRNVSVEAALARPEIQITPRPERAAELGVNTSTLATTIRIATIGDAESNLPRFNAGEELIPIRVRLEEAARNDLARLAGLRVPSSSGAQVPVAAVADVRLATGPGTIERHDGRYRVPVAADLARGALLGPAVAAIDQLPAAQAMPEGTSIQPSGDAETMAETFQSFGLAMGAGLLLVYLVLVLLFHSFVTPITILLSLPLAIGGAIFGLYVYGAGLGLAPVIGFLMLMGIVTKNAIMLVDFALEAVRNGADRASAMIDAGHKRARPIIMTTIAMSAGMVPSAMALGPGGEFRAPMAIAVIGGLLLSTLLSLLFVPSLFSVLEGLKDRLRALLAWGLGSEPEPAPEQAGG